MLDNLVNPCWQHMPCQPETWWVLMMVKTAVTQPQAQQHHKAADSY
jgi:hypothetical protein